MTSTDDYQLRKLLVQLFATSLVTPPIPTRRPELWPLPVVRTLTLCCIASYQCSALGHLFNIGRTDVIPCWASYGCCRLFSDVIFPSVPPLSLSLSDPLPHQECFLS